MEERGISDDDDWPVRAIVVVMATAIGAVALFELFVLLVASEGHGRPDSSAPIVPHVLFYAFPPLTLGAAIATWHVRWRRRVRIASLLGAALTVAGWWFVLRYL